MKRKIYIIILVMSIFNFSYLFGLDKLERIYKFDEGELWGLIIDSKNDSLLIKQLLTKDDVIYHNAGYYITNVVVFENDSNRYNEMSPDGLYLTKYSNKRLEIINSSNYQIISVIATKHNYYCWSYDSKRIYYDAMEGKGDKEVHKLYQFDITTGSNEQLYSSKEWYFLPIAVKNPDLIYLLNNQNFLDGPEESKIYRYSISQKKFEKVKLPVDVTVFMDYFTISPDERTVICQDKQNLLYFIDLQKQKVLRTLTNNASLASYFFNWKSDSSYVVFGMTRKDVYRYSIEK